MWEIDMGDRTSMRYRYEHRYAIWDIYLGYSFLHYRYGHHGHRYGIWASDMGDGSIDMLILHLDMGYLVTLMSCSSQALLRGVIDILEQCIGEAGLTYDDCEQGRPLLPVSSPLAPLLL